MYNCTANKWHGKNNFMMQLFKNVFSILDEIFSNKIYNIVSQQFLKSNNSEYIENKIFDY